MGEYGRDFEEWWNAKHKRNSWSDHAMNLAWEAWKDSQKKTLTVGDLVQQLQKLPQDATVEHLLQLAVTLSQAFHGKASQ